MKFTCKLHSVGNPDFRQYAPISEPLTVETATLGEMKAATEAYIRDNELGGGNWPSPVVKLDGKPICRFSYNLRCWDYQPKPKFYGVEIFPQLIDTRQEVGVFS